MLLTIIIGLLLAAGRVFVSPGKPTKADVYKDAAHLFMGGLAVALWRDGYAWEHWVFWGLSAWEVFVSVGSRTLWNRGAAK